jgi:hypothetical protein
VGPCAWPEGPGISTQAFGRHGITAFPAPSRESQSLRSPAKPARQLQNADWNNRGDSDGFPVLDVGRVPRAQRRLHRSFIQNSVTTALNKTYLPWTTFFIDVYAK